MHNSMKGNLRSLYLVDRTHDNTLGTSCNANFTLFEIPSRRNTPAGSNSPLRYITVRIAPLCTGTEVYTSEEDVTKFKGFLLLLIKTKRPRCARCFFLRNIVY